MEDKIQDFLRDLAERLMSIPAMYGTDQCDVDRLYACANELDCLEQKSGKLAGRV